MNKHYLQFLAFALPFAAYFINYVISYLDSRAILKTSTIKHRMVYILLFLLLFEFFIISSLALNTNLNFKGSLLYQGNPEKGLTDYKLSTISEDSLIVYDDRIYNSLTAWLFNGRNAISVSSLDAFMQYNQQSPNKKVVPVYFVECGIDRCGWEVPQEFNVSLENFFVSIRNQSIPKVVSFKEQVVGTYYNPLLSPRAESDDYYILYRTELPIDLDIAKQVTIQQSSFLYPLGYENKNDPTFKNFIYSPEGGFDTLLNKGARMFFYIDIFLSFFLIILLFRELIVNKENHEI